MYIFDYQVIIVSLRRSAFPPSAELCFGQPRAMLSAARSYAFDRPEHSSAEATRQLCFWRGTAIPIRLYGEEGEGGVFPRLSSVEEGAEMLPRHSGSLLSGGAGAASDYRIYMMWKC